ncbi:TrlF family AAA-like ATPase [Acerihabitans arboris]|uniref:AAA family ATPase n=1 Tax=Acerihabitans arboris TaxID=2691583 RepID=A0A845SRP3_9GAMM|nr:AAA family ATPase [Acerihabitans arboris]NDL65767.1 AAA family ATPase [Acerihabitans arboris]
MNKNELLSSKYPLGSEWRRWDLHVHTPESKLGDSFSGITWDAYVTALETTAQGMGISVIGITDYMTIDGYERLYRERNDPEKPRLQSVDFILPNIEFRAQPATKDGKALNIHLLIDPSDPDHIQKIKRALANLKIEYTSPVGDGQQSYGCIRNDLIAFARAQGFAGDDEAAYKYGVLQFKPSYEIIIKWFRNDGWLMKNCLVGVANGKDGISGLPADGFASTRDQLLLHSDFIFSGSSTDREYYLGKKAGTTPEKIRVMYRSLKPCLHGSDAHTLEKLFMPDLERNCWIKADPTFEGLRQVIWEPDCRVYIGKSRPGLTDQSRLISEIHIQPDSGWFSQSSVRLNPGLVAIIGEKGAGKTAIADLIAFAAGVPPDPKSQSSFIIKGKRLLTGMKVGLTWGSGTKTDATLTDSPHQVSRPLVRYLSQDFVERLCSIDHDGNELQVAIEEVVFSHLDHVHREGYSSFEELRSARESASQQRQDEYRGDIAALNREIDRLHAALAQKPEKIANREQLLKQIEEMRVQLPSIIATVDEKFLKQLDEEQRILRGIEGEITGLGRKKRRLDDFLQSYQDLIERTRRTVTELISASQLAEECTQEELERLHPRWDPTIAATLAEKAMSTQSEIEAKTGSEATWQRDGKTAWDIGKRLEEMKASLQQDESNKKRLFELQQKIASSEADASRIQKEIETLDSRTRQLLNSKETERDSSYMKYYQALAQDEAGLHELYAPMQRQLERLSPEMKFELSAGYSVDTRAWLEKASRFFDLRKAGAQVLKDEIEAFAIEHLSPAWSSGDLIKIKNEMEALSKLIDPAVFMSHFAAPSLKLIDLLDWMYSTDHVRTTYKIRYGGTDLEHLSPGTRGIALLVLYLLMDGDDSRPLLIDQPEGNLDNSSVYLQLVPYIRKAKEQRQIIIVTHNPNLVVSTDAEQIIIALPQRTSSQPYPQITYESGSLEHNLTDGDMFGIRQAVCTLLEGGHLAFKEREGRYSIS